MLAEPQFEVQTYAKNCPQDEGFPLFLSEDIPAEYYRLPMTEIHRRGMEAKARLGESVFILCHHYQRDETFFFGDAAGDSLNLSQIAAGQKAEFIIFCGVHFMAESADILTSPEQKVILPNLTAGCSMADMADADTVEDCWDYLEEILGAEPFVPITYINSSARLKAFCADHGGVVCTSSNSIKILKWAFDQGKNVFFFPDQHLGRNTALSMGVPREQIRLWQRHQEGGGLIAEDLRNTKVLLWNGFCSVHARFKVNHVEELRKRLPQIKIIVHPECTEEVVALADDTGSTNKIIDVITKAAPGTVWGVGTEINLVHRLQKQLKAQGKHIECLNSQVCPCSTMYRTHPANVLWVLDNLLAGRVVNQIKVETEVARLAKISLTRMLELS